MALEYLIRPNEDDWFNLHKDDFEKALRPTSYAFSVIDGWGDHRIEINDVQIAFSYEDPGIQVIFDGDVEQEIADQIISEIKNNLEKTTNQTGRVIQL